MLNHIVIQGRLTKDPELRRTSSGIPVASFCVAVERDWPNKETGEKETDFINCVAWRQTGEFINKYFNKGAMIIVSGRLQINKWVDDQGNNRYTPEIVVDNGYFGGSKKDSTESKSATATTTTYNTYSVPNYGYYVQPAINDFAMLDDDGAQLPF